MKGIVSLNNVMICNISLQFFPIYLLVIQKGDVIQIGKFAEFATDMPILDWSELLWPSTKLWGNVVEGEMLADL